MPTVVFYISGHGFGHASRDVEVINALGAKRPDLGILLRTAVQPLLLSRTLRVPYELRAGACDTGVVQSSSVAHDDEATIRDAIAFTQTLDQRADAEARALAGAGVALVVGDIPPLAFEVADRLGVPSIALGNFTWDWIYEAYAGFAAAGATVLPAIRQAYRKAALALELPFSGGFEIFGDRVQQLPLIARHAERTRDETRATLRLPPDRPLALLSFGGYGLPALNLANVDCLDEWTIVTTDRVDPGRRSASPEVVLLEEAEFFAGGFRYPDLVAAVDVVITKPGYGILSECIAAGTPMLYTSRGAFREYDLFVREMPAYLRCRFIEQADLFAGRWRSVLAGLRQQPPPASIMATDGAGVAAAIISERTQEHVSQLP